MSQNSKFGAITILLVVFVIGTLSGMGGTVYFLKQKHERRVQRDSRPPSRDIYRVQVERMTERLHRSLNLNEEQVPLIRAEIENFGNAMRSLHDGMKPQLDSLMKDRAAAIEKHLTAEQLESFREERKKHRERSKSWRDGKKPEGEGPRGQSKSGTRWRG